MPPATVYDSSFRSLNVREVQALSSLSLGEKLKDSKLNEASADEMEVSYEFMQGGFCICIIIVYEQPTRRNQPRYISAVYRGASRRSYKDPRNTVKGEMQAFCRALKCSRGVEI